MRSARACSARRLGPGAGPRDDQEKPGPRCGFLAPILSAPTPDGIRSGGDGGFDSRLQRQRSSRSEPRRSPGRLRTSVLTWWDCRRCSGSTLNGSTGAPPYRDYLSRSARRAVGAGRRLLRSLRAWQNLNVLIPIPGLGVVAATHLHDVVLALGRRSGMDRAAQRLPGVARRLQLRHRRHAQYRAVGPITLERGFVSSSMHWWMERGRFVWRIPIWQNPRAAAPVPGRAGEPVDCEPGRTASIQAVRTHRRRKTSIRRQPIQTIIARRVPLVVPPCAQLAAAFTDAWLLRPGRPPGFTCCERSNLSNPESMLFKRVDVVFTSGVPTPESRQTWWEWTGQKKRRRDSGLRITPVSSPS